MVQLHCLLPAVNSSCPRCSAGLYQEINGPLSVFSGWGQSERSSCKILAKTWPVFLPILLIYGFAAVLKGPGWEKSTCIDTLKHTINILFISFLKTSICFICLEFNSSVSLSVLPWHSQFLLWACKVPVSHTISCHTCRCSEPYFLFLFPILQPNQTLSFY